MNLYFLRHAIAVPRGTLGYQDEDRPLTAPGKRKMKGIAEGMLQMELGFDRILCSPYLRARQTAEIVSKSFSGEVELWKSLMPTANARQLIAALVRVPENNVLLVGHEPHLSTFISFLISGNFDSNIELKKGGLCKLSCEAISYGRCATLHWLMAPAQLRRLR